MFEIRPKSLAKVLLLVNFVQIKVSLPQVYYFITSLLIILQKLILGHSCTNNLHGIEK